MDLILILSIIVMFICLSILLFIIINNRYMKKRELNQSYQSSRNTYFNEIYQQIPLK